MHAGKFCHSDHAALLIDVSITFVDKKDTSSTLKRENYQKHTLKTFALDGYTSICVVVPP